MTVLRVWNPFKSLLGIGRGASRASAKGGNAITHVSRLGKHSVKTSAGADLTPAVFYPSLIQSLSGLSGGSNRPVNYDAVEITTAIVAAHYGLPVSVVDALRFSHDPHLCIGWHALARGWADDMRPHRIADRVAREQKSAARAAYLSDRCRSSLRALSFMIGPIVTVLVAYALVIGFDALAALGGY